MPPLSLENLLSTIRRGSQKEVINFEILISTPPDIIISLTGFVSWIEDFSLFKKIIDECETGGTKAITLASRGEPTLHPQLGEMLDYVKGSGPRVRKPLVLAQGGRRGVPILPFGLSPQPEI